VLEFSELFTMECSFPIRPWDSVIAFGVGKTHSLKLQQGALQEY